MIELDIFSYNQLSSSISKMMNTAHKTNKVIFNDFPSSVAKAVYIDSPIYTVYDPQFKKHYLVLALLESLMKLDHR